MDFVTGLPISTNWKEDSFDFILVIVDRLTKIVHYEPVKITIDIPRLAEVIMDVIVWHHGISNSIVTNRSSLFTSKFGSSLCYFFDIKRRLSTAFHPQYDGQIESQKSTMEAYLRAFVNFEQNNWAKLLSMAEFAYNNAKNASTGHTPFELNCGYHFLRFFWERHQSLFPIKNGQRTIQWSKRADDRLSKEPPSCSGASEASLR